MSRAPLILDLGKGVRGIYSVAIFHVVADCISFATTFLQTSSLTHSVAPPLQTEPATLGFGLVLATNLKQRHLSCWDVPSRVNKKDAQQKQTHPAPLGAG